MRNKSRSKKNLAARKPVRAVVALMLLRPDGEMVYCTIVGTVSERCKVNIRERILAAMYWNEPDQIPLTVYETILPRGVNERSLREKGVGLVYRPPAHQVEHREVEIMSREYWEAGRRLIRRTIRTPVGDVWQTLEPDTTGYEGNTWIKEHFIKEPEDYRVMEYYIKDAVYHDNYDFLRETIRRIGGDGLVYVRVAKSPIQEILYQMMGIERFSLHLYDHPYLIDSLHAVMLERYEELFELAAAAPVEILLLGDNITADMVGTDRFKKYLMPIYTRVKQHIAGTDKRLAVHMDGHLAALTNLIAETEIDIIEALTPPPMGDLSIEEARIAWPEKALWINFTSSMHIANPDSIETHTRQLLKEAGGKKGFAVGVTEDAPPEALERSLEIISKVIRGGPT